jgi:hypothetical protein
MRDQTLPKAWQARAVFPNTLYTQGMHMPSSHGGEAVEWWLPSRVLKPQGPHNSGGDKEQGKGH